MRIFCLENYFCPVIEIVCFHCYRLEATPKIKKLYYRKRVSKGKKEIRIREIVKFTKPSSCTAFRTLYIITKENIKNRKDLK